MKQYKIVYKGELQPEAVLSDVIQKVSLLYRIPRDKAEKFVCTKEPKIIKKNISLELSVKYQNKLMQTGLVVERIVIEGKSPRAVAVTSDSEKSAEHKEKLAYKCFCKATNKETNEPRYSQNWLLAKRAMFKIYGDRIECGTWKIENTTVEKAHVYRIKQWFIIPVNVLQLTTGTECYSFGFNSWANPIKHLKFNYSESNVRLRYSAFSIAVRLILIACIALYFLTGAYSLKNLANITFRKNTEPIVTTGILPAKGNKHIEALKHFIENGKKQGYFPSRILSDSNFKPLKLQDVSVDFRTIIDWVDGASCPPHSDLIILATSGENQYVECGFDDTVIFLGSGNDWVVDSWGNDIVLPGTGNDTIDVGYGNDIIIFEKNWGHDTIKISSIKVNKDTLEGYTGDYPWEFSSFIIFGEGITREEIVWKENQLVNTTTGDTITLNTKDVNILFASEPLYSLKDPAYIPKYWEPEMVQLKDLNAESVLVKGDIAYYAKGNDGLYIIDTTRLDAPKILSKTILQGRAMSVQISNDMAFISQVDKGLIGKKGWVSIVDIKSSRHPELIVTIPFGSGVHNVAVTDKYLYVPESNLQKRESKLHIYDISKPHKPERLSTTILENYTQYIAYLDETLYLSRRSSGIQVYDVRNPKKPKMTTEYGLGKPSVRSIKVGDNKIVVNQDDNNFIVLGPAKNRELYTLCKITTPLNEKYIGAIGIDSIWIRDNLVFRAEGDKGITITDISTPKHCKVVDTIPIEDLWISSVYIIKNTLVALNDQKGSSLYNLDTMYPEYKVKEPPPVIVESDTEEVIQLPELSKDQLQKLLYDAAADDDAEQVVALCKRGALPNVKGHLSHAPIEISARLGSLKSLKALLTCPGTPTPESMMLAALNEEFEAMKLLEEYGGDIGQTDEDGCTTLHYLAEDGTLAMVKYLIEQGVPVNATCRGEETALKWAQFGKNEEVITYLNNL